MKLFNLLLFPHFAFSVIFFFKTPKHSVNQSYVKSKSGLGGKKGCDAALENTNAKLV